MADIIPFSAARRRPSPEDDLLTAAQRDRLLANGARTAAGKGGDFRPVVRLRVPGANAVFLLTEIDPADPDRVYGLCDLGLGFVELGFMPLAALASISGPLGLGAVTDRDFIADRALSKYAAVALRRRRIDV